IYDEPEFVVHNVWRLYGGWYDGNPARLKPAPDRAVATEVARLAGGAARLAGHLAEWAAAAAPDDAGVHGVRADVFARRAEVEASTMSKGIFSWAAAESRARLEGTGGPGGGGSAGGRAESGWAER